MCVCVLLMEGPSEKVLEALVVFEKINKGFFFSVVIFKAFLKPNKICIFFFTLILKSKLAMINQLCSNHSSEGALIVGQWYLIIFCHAATRGQTPPPPLP